MKLKTPVKYTLLTLVLFLADKMNFFFKCFDAKLDNPQLEQKGIWSETLSSESSF